MPMFRKKIFSKNSNEGTYSEPVGSVVVQLHRDAGDAHRDKREWLEAAASYNTHLVENPEDYDIWVQLGHVLKEVKDWSGAAKSYDRALELRQPDSDLYLNLGHLYKIQGMLRVAMEYYRKSFDIDENESANIELNAICAPARNEKDAALAYQIFFGRTPEFDAPLQALQDLNDESLVVDFVSSKEFKARMDSLFEDKDQSLSAFFLTDASLIHNTFIERLGVNVHHIVSKPSGVEVISSVLASDIARSLFKRALGDADFILFERNVLSYMKKVALKQVEDDVTGNKIAFTAEKTRINLGLSVVKQHFSSSTAFEVDPKLIAFYLPQYHRVKENDEWWGEGFTEWTNVKKATPNFIGHNQPRIPLQKNYYDLADAQTQIWQAAEARKAGISAFCYYAYWFGGRRLLETPLDNMLREPAIDIDFCVCWANENWTKTWDGREKDILLGQQHSVENDSLFIKDMIKYFSDPRYLRVDGKLVMLVYRADLMPNSREVVRRWREYVLKSGLGELHLCAVQFYGITDPAPWGFDAAVEFPPHGWLQRENLVDPAPTMLNDAYSGAIFDYEKAVDFALRKPIPDYRWYRGVFPGWDNTARRQNTSHIFAYDSPDLFQRWLTEVIRQQIIMAPPEHQLVFINAWNEWGEGAYLEPDESDGDRKLKAVTSSLNRARQESEVLLTLKRLRQGIHYPDRDADESYLLNVLQGKERSLRFLMNELYKIKNNQQ